MAFNLDKNEEAKRPTKFDLTKNDAPITTVAEPEKRKSKTWLFVIPALLIAGIAAWYLLSHRSANNENGATATTTTDSTTDNIAPASQTEVVTPPTDTQAAIQTVNTESSTIPATNNGNASAGAINDSDTSVAVTASSLNKKVPATFPKGSDAIGNLDRSLVKDIIAFLEKNPAAVVTVLGYASSEGELVFNQQISQSRADAFKSHLISKGIAASKINAAGKGIDNPIGSNDTEEGRVKNRRVEISLQ